LSITATKPDGSMAGRYVPPGSRRAGSRSGTKPAAPADGPAEADGLDVALGGTALAGPALDGAVVLALGRAGAVETTEVALGFGVAQPVTASARRTTILAQALGRERDRIGPIADTSARSGSVRPYSRAAVLSSAIRAIHVAADGGSMLAAPVARRLIERFASAPDPARFRPELERLTPRESEVLRLIVRWMTNAEIAAEPVVTEHTAKTLVAHILDKLGIRDRVQAVILACESGVIRPGVPC
jgi:DNA-binding CsgD family transcriptional regulator